MLGSQERNYKKLSNYRKSEVIENYLEVKEFQRYFGFWCLRQTWCNNRNWMERRSLTRVKISFSFTYFWVVFLDFKNTWSMNQTHFLGLTWTKSCRRTNAVDGRKCHLTRMMREVDHGVETLDKSADILSWGSLDPLKRLRPSGVRDILHISSTGHATQVLLESIRSEMQ